MDSISSLFRVNMITTCSDSLKETCDINSILKNYDLINDLERVTFRDLNSNTAHQITQLRLSLNSIEDLQNRPDLNQIGQQLQHVVREESNKYKPSDIIDLDDTPWFERWKDKFISIHNNYDHDFIGSNFGVFIILSTKDLQTFNQIASKLLGQLRDNTLLRFMTNSFIEHYVIVNVVDDKNNNIPTENQSNLYNRQQQQTQQPYTTQTSTSATCTTITPKGDDSNSNNNLGSLETTNIVPPHLEQAYARFVNCFGQNNCSWLNIPKEQPSHNIVQFLKNFITISLVPWCERYLRILNDAISTRKGLRRNLVIATRQLLNIGQTSYVNQSVIYTPEAGEMQCRKLGDIAMCLGLYELASSSYDLAKKEFLNDSAWLYYAGACEAHAAAMYMLNKFQRHYIEKAVATYMDPCKSVILATRATILATDILRRVSPIDAAKFFVSLTGNDFDSDLQSALFLEQASRCYIFSRTRLRKASFYYVLAGYRYGRCNLSSLSLRCYAQFNASDWNAASEYVKLSSKHIMDQAVNKSQSNQVTTNPATMSNTSTHISTIADNSTVAPTASHYAESN